jgi:hypothetical protein
MLVSSSPVANVRVAAEVSEKATAAMLFSAMIPAMLSASSRALERYICALSTVMPRRATATAVALTRSAIETTRFWTD